VWWHTIVPTHGSEKTGYPTQKPEGIVRRMLQASTRPGDWCLDCFAGSGTLGAVAAQLGRRYVLIDSNPEAAEIMRARLGAGGVAGAETSAGELRALLGRDGEALMSAWRRATERHPDRTPSESLSLAEAELAQASRRPGRGHAH